MKYELNETIATGKFKQVLAENYTKNFKLLCQSIKLNKVQQKILDSFITHGTIKNQYVGRVAGVKKEKKFFAAKKQYKGSIDNRTEALMSALKVNTHQKKILDSYLKTGKVIGKYAGSIAGSTKSTKDYSAFRGFKEHVELLEGTWLLPKGPKAQKDLKALLKNPIPLGKDGDNATDAIDTFIGDDSLLDDLYAAGKKNPKADARSIIKKHMKRLRIKEGAEIYTVKKGSFTRKVDGKTADKMKRQGWKLVAKETVSEATGREITLDWDMDDPGEYAADWQDQGVYLDDWNKRKMEIEVSGMEKDLLKWLVDDYGMDKREAQNVIRKGKKVKL